MRLFRQLEIKVKEIPWIASRPLAGFRNPAAVEFYQTLMANGYEIDALLNVLPKHKLIYIGVPKVASTRIRRTLARIDGRFIRSLKPRRRSMHRGPCGPRNITVDALYWLATDPGVLRFSFVRNPYARLVSCWADKFAGKPLTGGDIFVDAYLAARRGAR